MAKRKRSLAQHGVKRPLDRTDIVSMLVDAHTVSFSKSVNMKALKNVGLIPFTRAPIYREHIARTRDTPRAPGAVLDASKIQFHIDNGELANASAELCKQLGGNKFGTSNMWRYLANGSAGIAIAKAFNFHQEQEKAGQREAAERALMRKEDVQKAVRTAEVAVQKAAKKKAAAASRAKAKTDAAAKRKADKEAVAKKKAADQSAAAKKKPLITTLEVAHSFQTEHGEAD